MKKAPSNARFIAHALMVFAAVSCSVEAGSPLGDDHQQGTFISLNLRPVHTVCWRNSTPESQPYERIVQDIIEREYNAKTEAKFLGWKPCSGTDLTDGDVGITWDIVHPNSSINLVYDFERSYYQAFRTSCVTPEQKKHCVQNQALHEFGHVLGLMHENTRPERPATEQCMHYDEAIPFGPWFVFGPYDSQSIMNRCYYRSRHNQPLALSQGDVATINAIYTETYWQLAEHGEDPCAPGYDFYLRDKPLPGPQAEQLGVCILTESHDDYCPANELFDEALGGCRLIWCPGDGEFSEERFGWCDRDPDTGEYSTQGACNGCANLWETTEAYDDPTDDDELPDHHWICVCDEDSHTLRWLKECGIADANRNSCQ